MENTSAPSPDRARAWITPAVILAVVGISLLFAFKSLGVGHWYSIFKLVHVAAAVFWVGGGLLLTALAIRAERSDNPEDLATIARQAAWVGEKLFAPAGGIVLAMGIAMVLESPAWDWGTTWVTIALVGWAISFVTGIAVLSPRAKRLTALLDTVGAAAPETQAAVRQLLLIARVDVGVLVLVVADMALKPYF